MNIRFDKVLLDKSKEVERQRRKTDLSKKSAVLNEIKRKLSSIRSSQVSSEGNSQMLEAEALDLIQQLSKFVGQDKLIELLQPNSSADGSIKQEDDGKLQTVPEEDEKERETTMRNMTLGQGESYRGQNPISQLSLVPEEEIPSRASMTGYSNALGASVHGLKQQQGSIKKDPSKLVVKNDTKGWCGMMCAPAKNK